MTAAKLPPTNTIPANAIADATDLNSLAPIPDWMHGSSVRFMADGYGTSLNPLFSVANMLALGLSRPGEMARRTEPEAIP
jgi:hypothetical protein